MGKQGKLVLSKETLRQLDDQDLSGVAGGTIGLGNTVTGILTGGLTGGLPVTGQLTGHSPTFVCVDYSLICI
jgi:hypothetical protein